MVKISIAADSRKNNSIFAASFSAPDQVDQQKTGQLMPAVHACYRRLKLGQLREVVPICD